MISNSIVVRKDFSGILGSIAAVALAIIPFSPAQASATDDLTSKLKYVRAITPAGKSGTLAAVRLDKEIYDAIDDFSDIRVVDSSKAEVPFRVRLLQSSKNKIVKTTGASKVVFLKRLPDNSLELVVKNLDRKSRTPTELTFETPNRNYDKKISIATALKLDGPWTTFGGEQSIFDYSAVTALSNKTVTLPKDPKGRFYKISISNFSEMKQSKRFELVRERRSGKEFREVNKVMRFNDDFKIDSLTFIFEESVKVRQAPIEEPAESAIIANSVVKKNTVTIIRTYGQPITRLKLTTPSVNFSRKTTLNVSEDQKRWSFVCDAAIAKIRVGAYTKTDLMLKLPEIRSKYLKLVVHNQDAPPLEISDVKCSRNAYAAEFIVPSGGVSLKIYYGGNVPAPCYDIDAVLADLQNPAPVFLKLDPEKLNPAYSLNPDESFWNGTTFMYLAIGATVVFLVVLLFSGLRKIDSAE